MRHSLGDAVYSAIRSLVSRTAGQTESEVVVPAVRAVVVVAAGNSGVVADAERVVAAEATAGRPLVQVAFMRQYDPADLQVRSAMNDLLQLDRAVVFIDEFDEIASAREHNSSTKGVVNELLKMIPLFRSTPGHLLVCATNFVADIDSAVLRPGRFDLVIPIGPPDLSARRSLWEAALARLDHQGVDVEELALKTQGYTPGDVELASQRAAAAAFDRIREGLEPAFVASAD
mgnify:CR=1 FL=1